MKAAVDVLTEFERMNVKLWIDGEKLRYRGPSDVLTPDVLDTLKKIKKQLMQFLSKTTKAKGYGCCCGHNLYHQIEKFIEVDLSDDAQWKKEIRLSKVWQCENCKTIYEIIGGTKGPEIIN